MASTAAETSATMPPPPLDKEALRQGGAAGYSPAMGAAETVEAASSAPQSAGGRRTGATSAGAKRPPVAAAEYAKGHGIHVLLDNMVNDIVADKPEDSSSWMLRWFLEQHRQQCEEKHKFNSPNHMPKVGSYDQMADGDSLPEVAVPPPPPLQYD